MLYKELQKLNLSGKEAKAYLALLELGEASIQQIGEKAKIKRTTVYTVIGSLKEKGLLGATKHKKRNFYFAENPQIILRQLDEKKHTINKIMPELMSIANLIDKKPKIQFFEGTEGIKKIYRDTLKYPKQEILMWGAPEMFDFLDHNFMWDYYVPERIKNKIWLRGLGPEVEMVKKIKLKDKKQLRESRLFPAKKYMIEVEINLYGKQKIGIMSFKEQIGLIIESRKIYNSLKSIFEMNWAMLE